MGEIMNAMGTTLTQFLKGLSKVWEWLTIPLWTWEGIDYTPLGLLGIGFAVIIGIIFIKELIF